MSARFQASKHWKPRGRSGRTTHRGPQGSASVVGFEASMSTGLDTSMSARLLDTDTSSRGVQMSVEDKDVAAGVSCFGLLRGFLPLATVSFFDFDI